jgi:hypothetical protein
MNYHVHVILSVLLSKNENEYLLRETSSCSCTPSNDVRDMSLK